MSEYRVGVKVQNNLLLSAIERQGFKRVADFCRYAELSPSVVGDIINLKKSPMLKCGEFSTIAKQIMECLGASPSDLWTDEQLYMSISSNKAHFSVREGRLRQYLSDLREASLQDMDPARLIEMKETQEKVREVIRDTLEPREADVVESVVMNENTLDAQGKLMGVSKERVRQLENKAIRKLRWYSKNDKSETLGDLNEMVSD